MGEKRDVRRGVEVGRGGSGMISVRGRAAGPSGVSVKVPGLWAAG